MRRRLGSAVVRCSILAVFVLRASAVVAGTTVTVLDQTARPGTTVSIPISLETDAEVVGIQLDIRFDADRFVASTATGDDNLPSDIRVKASNLAPGRQRLVVYGTGLSFLPAQRIAKLSFAVPPDVLAAPSTIQLEGLLLGGAQSPVDIPDGTVRNGTLSIAVVPAEIDLSGSIRYYNGDHPISGVNIKVRGGTMVDGLGNESGNFRVRVPSETSIMLSLEKLADSRPNRGVTTLDLLFVRRHVLGLDPFDSPWKRLAADVDRHGDIGVIDLLLMRQIILGLASHYVMDQPVFRFFPAATVFSDVARPWDTTDVIGYASLTNNLLSQDFIGVKLGDVDGDWGSSGLESNRAGGEASRGGLARRSLSPRESVRLFADMVQCSGSEDGFVVDVEAKGFTAVTSLQFSVHWDPDELVFGGLNRVGLPDSSESNFGLQDVALGKLSFAWSDPSLLGVTLEPDEPLFSLDLRAIVPEVKSRVAFGSSPTPMVATRGFSFIELSLTDPQTDKERVTEVVFDFLVSDAGHPTLVLATPGEVGMDYYFEYSNHLPATGWTVIDVRSGRGGLIRFEDSNPPHQNRFYRIRQGAVLLEGGDTK
ncbi:MAG: hypothetical protein M2R46_05152 [Verrucomicrobia subdivision 3 bacterium]|nr:hypothetical protein [Limisphaerales bacterium]